MKHLSLDEDEDQGRLRSLALEVGVCLSPEQATLVLRHLSMVISANERLNLTRIVDPEEGIRLHLVDSLSCLPDAELAPPGEYADIGAGAGFPGIPLAVVSGRRATLVESIRKKARFLEESVETLQIADRVLVYPGRAEMLARERPERFALITARAVSSLASLVELASPLLEVGGRFIALKGTPEDDEFERGDLAASQVGLERESVRVLTLPGGDESRTIIRYAKKREPDIELPRAEGRAQSRPLA